MTVATAVVASARLREESRGAHWRDDFEGRREAGADTCSSTATRAAASGTSFVPAGGGGDADAERRPSTITSLAEAEALVERGRAGRRRASP